MGSTRLLGYANAQRALTDLIPVVAFENLPRERQIQIFMEINENQQSVGKNLRNTLNADLLWGSENLRERSRAIKLRIAQRMGEDRTSALYDRVLIGEAPKTSLRCITIDSIKNGLDRSALLAAYNKHEIRARGFLERESPNATYDTVREFLTAAFNQLRDGLPDQWSRGGGEGGFVFLNVGVEALVRILSDIVDHTYRGQDVPDEESGEDVAARCSPLISKLVNFLAGLSDEDGALLRKKYGSGGPTAYWRSLQAGLQSLDPGFDPPGLAEYMVDQERRFNTEAFALIRDIETFLKRDVKARLIDRYGAGWRKEGVPHQVYADAQKLMVDKNRDRSVDDEVTWWDCLHLVDYEKIMTKEHAVWVDLFDSTYAPPDQRGKKGGAWKDRASWLRELNRIRNQNAHEYVVSAEEFQTLTQIAGWLLPSD